jgi:hypothetical protein
VTWSDFSSAVVDLLAKDRPIASCLEYRSAVTVLLMSDLGFVTNPIFKSERERSILDRFYRLLSVDYRAGGGGVTFIVRKL